MIIVTLIPHFPVIVVSKGNVKGHVILVTDYGPETHKVWTVVIDETGEVWDVQNPGIRFCWNFTRGRMP